MPASSLRAIRFLLLVALIRRARMRAQRRLAMHADSRHYQLPLTGNEWVKSLLEGDESRFIAQARMPKKVFVLFCRLFRERGLLADTKRLNVEAKFMILLRLAGHVVSVREIAERFQVSLNTVSVTISQVLEALLTLAPELISLPQSSSTPSKILDNDKFYPYFEHCIGAADGTHIAVQVPEKAQARFRNRKGTLSQNVLAATDFDGKFIYVLAGWEGQANDMAVLNDAMLKRGLKIPSGRYLLVDNGYANRMQHIAPFRNVRYHLKEFERGNRGCACFAHFLLAVKADSVEQSPKCKGAIQSPACIATKRCGTSVWSPQKQVSCSQVRLQVLD
jgi:DNA-binding transcriptional ArsR family regulator